MKSIQKVLVTTDLSENSRRGVVYACSLAAENKGVLTILHVANEFGAWEIYSDEFSFLEPTTRRAWPSDRVLSEANLDLNHFLEQHLEAMKKLSCVTKRVVLGVHSGANRYCGRRTKSRPGRNVTATPQGAEAYL
jgi:hypothetical protein